MIVAMTTPTLRNWLEVGPFSLVMSSGFFGFYAHGGVLAALESQGLVPAAVAGSSAGGLVAGAWAAGLDAETINEALLGLRRTDFWDPGPGLGLLRGALFRRRLERLLPVSTFEACRVPLAARVRWRRRFTPPAPCRCCFIRCRSTGGSSPTAASPTARVWPGCRQGNACLFITWPGARPGACVAPPCPGARVCARW
jgi:NTE family protein